MRQNNDSKFLLLKEEKLDPRKILFSENNLESNKENNYLNSNIIISNTLLDSLCNNNQENIQNSQKIQKRRALAFSRKNSICSNSSIHSINGNFAKENKNKNNFNLIKKEKLIIKNSKINNNLIKPE